MRQRNKLLKQFKETGDVNIQDKYKHCRNKAATEVRKANLGNDSQLDNSISSGNVSSTKWWKICRKQ